MRHGISQFGAPLTHFTVCDAFEFPKPKVLASTSPHVVSVPPEYCKVCGHINTDVMLLVDAACVGLNNDTCGYRGEVVVARLLPCADHVAP